MRTSWPGRLLRCLGFYLLPLAVAAAAVFLIASPERIPGLASRPFLPAFLVCVIAVAGLVPALRVLLNAAREKRERLRGELRSAVALRRTREAQLRTLRRDIEILSAIREIGVIVNADDEFKDVLTKVLDLVDGAIKARDLVLYLVDADSRTVEPVARRFDGRSHFRRKIRKPPTAPGRVTEALEHRCMMKDFHGETPVLTLPLLVDREAVGALKVSLDLEEDGEEAVAQIEDTERFLRGLERHLSLAIKAPSLYHRAVVDALTGLYSRRHFDNQLAGYFKISQRRGTPLGFILADIDHFKNVNDTFGHPTGDAVLAEVARILQREIREYDSAYRYGGEEMCVILPQTGEEDTARIAERIRARVEAKTFRSDKRKPVPVTLSLGVGAFAGWMTEPAQLVARTDQALYRAKEGGRNRVERADLSAGPADDREKAASKASARTKARTSGPSRAKKSGRSTKTSGRAPAKKAGRKRKKAAKKARKKD